MKKTKILKTVVGDVTNYDKFSKKTKKLIKRIKRIEFKMDNLDDFNTILSLGPWVLEDFKETELIPINVKSHIKIGDCTKDEIDELKRDMEPINRVKQLVKLMMINIDLKDIMSDTFAKYGIQPGDEFQQAVEIYNKLTRKGDGN